MKKSVSEWLDKRKAEVKFRTDRTQAMFGEPQLSASPVVYEIAEKNSCVERLSWKWLFTQRHFSMVVEKPQQGAILWTKALYGNNISNGNNISK